MKLIKPSEISARILTLLEESDERVIIVSPYMKISKWYKFMNKVSGLKTRRIHTEIYVGEDPNNSATYSDLDQLALQYNKIPHLQSEKAVKSIRPIRSIVYNVKGRERYRIPAFFILLTFD